MTDTSDAEEILYAHEEWGRNAGGFFRDLEALSTIVQREIRVKDNTAPVVPFLTQTVMEHNVEGVYGINKFEEGAKIPEKYRAEVAEHIYHDAHNLIFSDKVHATTSVRADVARYALEGLVDAYARICQAEPPRFDLVQKWVDQGVKSFNYETADYKRAVKKSTKKGTVTDVPALEALADQINQRARDYFSFGVSGRNALTALIEKKSLYVRAKESAKKNGAAALAVITTYSRKEIHPIDASRRYASKAWTATADARKKAGASISSVGSSIGNAGSSIASRVKNINKRKAALSTALVAGAGVLLWTYGPDVYDYAARRTEEVTPDVKGSVEGVASNVQERLDAQDKLDRLQTTLASTPYNTPVSWDNFGNPDLKNAPGAMFVDIDGNGRFDDNAGKAATVDDLVGMYQKASEQPREVIREVRVPAKLSAAVCKDYCLTPRVASASRAEPTVAPAPQPSAAPSESVVQVKKPFKKPY